MIPAPDSASALQRARMMLRSDRLDVHNRDTAILTLWIYDRQHRHDYAEKLSRVDDPTSSVAARAGALRWIMMHTASTDALGWARIDRILSDRHGGDVTPHAGGPA